ncbi:FAD-dependent oxidoreductase [Emcibacter nanhaiensis]|uniref:FAD-dependent oxidoreductase n=1 Tax=Emcibacter nanhaiensis TaxID=1505037 RepID=A0A501PFE0_9PROT|nr:FAD-dependent oxidoreductase [Emcibacter nanhaiensis]TPD59133.1 FAD-dependent oxidoreductase [Emcibacter nanhaiensis]
MSEQIQPVSKSGVPVRKHYGYRRPAVLDQGGREELEVLVVGGGPIGLTAGLDLARKGYKVVILNQMDILADGSKAICFAKQVLDVYDRLGINQRVMDKSVVWNVGKVFWGDRPDPIYEFDMLPVKNQKNPGFVNLQQYYLEEFLIDELESLDNVEIRWKNKLVSLEQDDEKVTAQVETPDGNYEVECKYLIACDGNKSPIRTMLGLDFEGRVFEDNFLIADIKFPMERPSERWFWFEPAFKGQSALLHKQPDDVWRLDFQVGWDVDKAEAIKEENVKPFIHGMLGDDVEFEWEWRSIYTFQCRRMARFLHGRVIFAGDAAHLVSPFGARGANSGVADVNNLVWKLDMVLKGKAPACLLESYNYEQTITADENILNSTRSTDFITPKSAVSKYFRNAVLSLAEKFDFARPLVNSGRLSVPVSFPDSPLNTKDEDLWAGGIAPGSPVLDAPVNHGKDWLQIQLGNEFLGLYFAGDDGCSDVVRASLPVRTLVVGPDGAPGVDLVDDTGLVRERYDAAIGTLYLIRPDQYVAGRWKQADPEKIQAALARATGEE